MWQVLRYIVANKDKIGLLFNAIKLIGSNPITKAMLVKLLLDAVKGAATIELAHLLDKFKEKNGEDKYNQLVAAIRNSFTLLEDVVDDTKTKIDDTVVAIVLKSLPE